ncbi:MAG: prepilin-type N-terminal cleavage/methylation domain-containing protein [Planctomycetota bacterium]
MRYSTRGASDLRRTGFTLIELVVVLVIMALLVSIAAVSLRGTMDRYHLNQAKQVIISSDAKARRQARSIERPLVMTIDRRKRQIRIGESIFRIPAAVEVASVDTGRRVTVGTEVEIDFGRSGWSPSYAVELKRGSASRWIVVLGGSGQVLTVEDREAADELLSL